MKRMEMIILKSLLRNEPFLKKALPYLAVEYFNESRAEQIIFDEIKTHVDKYKIQPSIEALWIAITRRPNTFEQDVEQCEEMLDAITKDQTPTQDDWLNVETEKFCQEKALYNAVHSAIQIMGDKSGKSEKGTIPKLLQDALSISFDPNVGHDYIEDADGRYEYYHRKNTKYPFTLKKWNQATGGGLEAKTLNVILAGPKVGKSLIMCNFAADYMAAGYNVLYITMEMAEEKISQRIDANLLDITIDNLIVLPKENYDKKIARMREQVKGKLIVKEYPTATANANHFRALLNELLIKKGFKPDIIFIDYLNICTSSRIKAGSNVNSYTLIKSIAEELRGLANEAKAPIVSATQITRAGFKNSDPDMDDTSESFGLPATVDEMWAVTTSDELRALNQLKIKKLASRSTDVNDCRHFVCGVNYGKMKLMDVDDDNQNLSHGGYQQVTPSKTGGGMWDKFKNIGNTEQIDLETGEIINQ